MKIIPVIHKLLKLCTLKHSRFKTNFTLKHSRGCAETLPPTIYAYIYLYIKTCSYEQQIVNNFFIKNKFTIFSIGLMTISLTACVSPAQKFQESQLHLINPPHCCFKQIHGTKYHPNEFFTCDQQHNRLIGYGSSKKCSMRIPSSNIYGEYHHE